MGSAAGRWHLVVEAASISETEIVTLSEMRTSTALPACQIGLTKKQKLEAKVTLKVAKRRLIVSKRRIWLKFVVF